MTAFAYTFLGLTAWAGLLGKLIVQGRASRPILSITATGACAGVLVAAIGLLDYTAGYAFEMMAVKLPLKSASSE